MLTDHFHSLALNRVPGIGPVYARSLYHQFGDAAKIFSASASQLSMVRGLPRKVIHEIRSFKDFPKVEKELRFLEKYKIRTFFFTEPDYPQRLLRLPAAPPLLFYLGNADLNAPRILSVVGTRIPTEYGKSMTESLIKDLSGSGILIVSGLAYGIDTAAHAAALQHGLPTLGILGHGLDRIYPSQNCRLARTMVTKGGLLTRFNIGTEPDECNFPLRNQMVAAISDATLVIETADRGGSLLTVANAVQTQKKVFAIPGRVDDPRSTGCNSLIAKGQATLLTDATQLLRAMHWAGADTPLRQTQLFDNSTATANSPDEHLILTLLRQKQQLTHDEILRDTRLSNSGAALALLNLELRGALQTMPGKRYRIIT